jgi:carboxyl-terminal processing protease
VHNAVKAERDYYSSLVSGLDSFFEVKNRVDTDFVGDVDYEKIDGLLADYYVSLIGDKYSNYYTSAELQTYLNKISGKFVGIGISCSKKDGKIYVENVIKDSPAMYAGICVGESIVSVDGLKVTSDNYNEVTSAVSGEKGTSVKLGVEDVSGNVREVSVVRQEIVTDTVEYRILDENIGYVKITQFSGNTATQFLEAVDLLLKSGVNGFLFDVRDNSGGELNSVVAILDRLLPEGPIVHIVSGNGKTETKYSTNEKFVELPMAVLANENTASAAELFTAALRDYEKAKIYGTTTYGKGYMQRVITLTDGSGLKLSIAKYNPPCGENYEGKGVSPHVEVLDDASTEVDEQLEKAKNYFIN